MFLGLRQAQLISIALMIMGIAGLMVLKKKKDLHTDLQPASEVKDLPAEEEGSGEENSPSEDADA